MRVTVRAATAADAEALGSLRWRWVTEGGDDPGTERAAFVEFFAAWVGDRLPTHLAFLAEADGEAVAMAWLMVAERVPAPAQPVRRCGDVQSVYVVPELRDSGVGAALMEAVLARARRLDLEHVTVHSSERAVSLYQRAGFQHDRCWLSWQAE
ncbi:N-acetylglutamate synthase, GNAT family [Micromonospora phaseoli]|uniref:N-acetylglutamate synthase, GNAT family n=2 Tax=Micromonospora phaseoli TaxID=1144548 RepID=A0A1H6RCZ9_9ACTN|nr:N-acetylglutamate synthase-like GNAT family acetyltransferase [Micromonospora phaseoli]GIJ78383.1 N-acetyltransferase [Micromonospora phaseoli]SEI50407.1 N-acetylglutamate synthase, GNAT family [Micromonospora phaseoli]